MDEPLPRCFLELEFEVEGWAVDLWFNASENVQRIRAASVANHVYPVYAEARALPFGDDIFDAVVTIDSFSYFGTDDLYLNHLARFVKPGGAIGIAGAGTMREMEESVPDSLARWWGPNMFCLHSSS